jgi:single stranded DNA-binding protein
MSSLNMPNINQVALSGRVVEDPDFRFVENGAARLSGRIAVNRSYRDRNEEWQEETSFFGIVLWQKAAEAFSQPAQRDADLCYRPTAKPLLAR